MTYANATRPRTGTARLAAPPPDTSIDEELVRTMYEEDRRALLSFVMRLTGGDTQRAEDVVQETMLRAWQNAAKLHQRRSSLRPWLVTVARNVVIDSHRRLSARPSETEPDSLESLPVPDESDNLLASIMIADALASLSSAHRAVIVELYYRGATPKDAAVTLNVPVGTVKSRAYYALRALRLALEQRGVTPGL